MKKQLFILFTLITGYFFAQTPTWSLRLKSTVELRSFKLTNKIETSESKLAGATISLYKGSALVTQMQSDGNGEFIIEVPSNGDYMVVVTYPGCNAKRFSVSTMGVPDAIVNDKYSPSFGIEGVVMAKGIQGVDYSILQQPLVKIGFVEKGKKFNHNEAYTNQMLGELMSLRNVENAKMESFTSTNNIGDIALNKGDCATAKASYEKAMTIIPGERYPSDQLFRVGTCLKEKELADKKAADEAAAKKAAEELAAKKAAEEKAAQDKLAAEKKAAEELAAKKAAEEKAAQEKLAAEKKVAEELAAKKAAEEKAAQEKLAAENAAAKAKLDAEKAEKERIAKENAAKAAAAKAKADEEKELVMKQKLAKEKAEKEKVEAEKIAKAKAEADKVAAEKATAEKLANENKDPKLITPISSGSESSNDKIGSGDAKYSIPQAIGSSKYPETIKRANELFKMKRYAEAKPVYEEALKYKPNDPTATAKLVELEKLIK